MPSVDEPNGRRTVEAHYSGTTSPVPAQNGTLSTFSGAPSILTEKQCILPQERQRVYKKRVAKYTNVVTFVGLEQRTRRSLEYAACVQEEHL